VSRLFYVYLLTAFFIFLHFNYAEMFLVFCRELLHLVSGVA